MNTYVLKSSETESCPQANLTVLGGMIKRAASSGFECLAILLRTALVNSPSASTGSVYLNIPEFGMILT